MPIVKKPDVPTEPVAPLDGAPDAPTGLDDPVPTEPETAVPQPGRYRFIYLDKTIYPALGLTVEHGDEHDWPDGPPSDGRWTLADERK